MNPLKNSGLKIFSQSAKIIELDTIPKILVVEDDKANQMVISYWLTEYAYDYEIVDNGEEAFKKFQTGNFPVVLMDVRMHGMDGYEVTKNIREFEKANKLKHSHIIALTANAFLGDRNKCIKSGMSDYISKPIDFSELKRKLAELIQPTI